MVSYGSELVRYNPGTRRIEYSTNRGALWSTRAQVRPLGDVRAIVNYGKYLLACSDKGIFVSSDRGASWKTWTTSYKSFIDIFDGGRELLANTADGHIYVSKDNGYTWYRRS
jgi:hypothetical protein